MVDDDEKVKEIDMKWTTEEVSEWMGLFHLVVGAEFNPPTKLTNIAAVMEIDHAHDSGLTGKISRLIKISSIRYSDIVTISNSTIIDNYDGLDVTIFNLITSKEFSSNSKYASKISTMFVIGHVQRLQKNNADAMRTSISILNQREAKIVDLEKRLAMVLSAHRGGALSPRGD
jgi:hypothetical protein